MLIYSVKVWRNTVWKVNQSGRCCKGISLCSILRFYTEFEVWEGKKFGDSLPTLDCSQNAFGKCFSTEVKKAGNHKFTWWIGSACPDNSGPKSSFSIIAGYLSEFFQLSPPVNWTSPEETHHVSWLSFCYANQGTLRMILHVSVEWIVVHQGFAFSRLHDQPSLPHNRRGFYANWCQSPGLLHLLDSQATVLLTATWVWDRFGAIMWWESWWVLKAFNTSNIPRLMK